MLDALIEHDEIVENKERIPLVGETYRASNHYSSWLKEGICQTLILIAVLGDDYNLTAIDDKQDWVDSIINEVLGNLTGDTLISVNQYLTLLSEASPKFFLNALQKSLLDKNNNVRKIFNIDSSLLFSNHHHTSLLFALETLAWDPALLNQVTLILVELCKLDPGVKIENKPINSLHYIFLPWCPQTYENYEQRFSILDTLIKNEPEIGWQLLASLLPKHSDSGWLKPKYRWRQIADYTQTLVTFSELFIAYDRLVSTLLMYINGDGTRLSILLNSLTSLYPLDQEKIIQFSSNESNISTNKEDFISALRLQITNSRSFSDQDWALSKANTDSLEIIYNNLIERDNSLSVTWLFDSEWPVLIDYTIQELRYNEESFRIINEKRISALKDIYNKRSLEGIEELVNTVKYPHYVGIAFAHISNSNENDSYIFSKLDDPLQEFINFCNGYIHERSRILNEAWSKESLDYLISKNETPNKVANFLLSLSYKDFRIWAIVDTLSEEVNDLFWQKHNPALIDSSYDNTIKAIEKLILHNRYATALSRVRRSKHIIPTDLIIEILNKLGTENISASESSIIDSYDILRAINTIQDRSDANKSQIITIEWLYIKFLDGTNSRETPKFIYNELAHSPKFFQELIFYMCKPEKGYEEHLDDVDAELRSSRALSAYIIFSKWNVVPGTSVNGKIDYNVLKEWVDEARELCSAIGRIRNAEYFMGEMFGRSSAFENDWPQEAICKIIEEVDSDKITTGFYTSVRNQRGAYSKLVEEGGNQERALSERFKSISKKLSPNWPRISNVLQSIAKSYDQQAREEDNEALEQDLEN